MNKQERPKILLTFRVDGANGGPYISHQRILESRLSETYDLGRLMLENPRKLRRPKAFWRLVKTIKQEKPDIVHLAGLQTEGFLTMLACRMAGVKTVLAVHGSSTQAIGYGKMAQFIFRSIERYTVKHATAAYGVSDYVSSWDICKRARHYHGTVYNIAEFGSDLPTQSTLREELGIAPEDVVVVSTGRITRDKGFDLLWEVAQRTKDLPNVHFVIAGDGAYRAELQAAVDTQGMADRVHLLGYRTDVDNILCGSDIFMICTKHETLCISLLEAGIAGLPMIASDVGGIPEIVKQDENGFLVPVGDVDGFETALRALVANPEQRAKMGERAQTSIQTTFDQENILKRLESIYDAVLASKKR